MIGYNQISRTSGPGIYLIVFYNQMLSKTTRAHLMNVVDLIRVCCQLWLYGHVPASVSSLGTFPTMKNGSCERVDTRPQYFSRRHYQQCLFQTGEDYVLPRTTKSGSNSNVRLTVAKQAKRVGPTP